MAGLDGMRATGPCYFLVWLCAAEAAAGLAHGGRVLAFRDDAAVCKSEGPTLRKPRPTRHVQTPSSSRRFFSSVRVVTTTVVFVRFLSSFYLSLFPCFGSRVLLFVRSFLVSKAFLMSNGPRFLLQCLARCFLLFSSTGMNPTVIVAADDTTTKRFGPYCQSVV